MREPDSQELHWAAGFFDGEGYTGVRVPTGRDYGYLVMNIGQVEREPLERFKAAVGGGHIYGPYATNGKNSRPAFKWQANGWEARRVLAQISWFISGPKYRQAYEAAERATYGRLERACA